MAPRKKGHVFRVTGLPASRPDDALQASLKAAIVENMSGDEKSSLSINAAIIPSCYDNENEKVALVEFSGGIPGFLSELIAGSLRDWQVEMDDNTDVSFDCRFFGFTQLYTPNPDGSITADIIAITGLDGHAYGSWRGKGNLGRMWLRDFLSRDLPYCRTMIYGYDSKLSSHGIDKILDYGRELIEELKKVRNTEELRHRPLFFIAHSFGGIILAHCLIKAVQTDDDDHPTIAALYRATYGMLLFGIPHKGLVMDDIQKMLSKNDNHPRIKLLREIETKSDLLAYQLVDFKNLIRDRKIVSFYETGQTRQLEFDIESNGWKRTGNFVTAVDADSALLQLPDSMEEKIPLDCDHSTIVKFDSNSNRGYTSARDKLKQFEKDAAAVVAARFYKSIPFKPVSFNNVPRGAVAHFVPRVKAYKELDGWLRHQPPSEMLVLQGIGGSGKTQMALQCCQMAKDLRFLATLWVNASSPTTVVQSYRSILRLISPGYETITDEIEIVRMVQSHIGNWTGRWLIVFDNYNNPKAFHRLTIRDYIPNQGGNIMFTSRHRDTSRLGRCIDLSKMTENEGVKLLLQDSSNHEHSEAAKVVTMLGSLALALDQAGAYIRARNLPLCEFAPHYKKRRMSVLEEIPEEWEYHEFHDGDSARRLSALTTWEMSLDLIDGASEAEKMQKIHLLTLASFMDPFQISEVYFQTYNVSNTDWMGLLRTRDKWDSDKLVDLLAELSRLSLVQSVQSRTNGHSFSMHPLICDWMRVRKATNANSTVTELTNMLTAFLQTYDYESGSLESNQETIRHLHAWSEINESILQDSYEAILVTHCQGISVFTKFYRLQALYSEAEHLSMRALNVNEQKQGPKHPETLMICSELAGIYWRQGLYSKAEQLFKRALEGNEEKLGPMDPDTLRALQNLGIVYRDQGRYNEAERLYIRALEGREKVLGLKHPDTLQTLQNLALVYWNKGRYSEAERSYKRVLEGYEEKLRPKHPRLLNTLQNLALVYREQGRYDEAEQTFKQALEGYEEKLRPKHPDTVRTLQNLALIYRDQGRYYEAEQLFKQALERREEKLGPKHPDILWTNQNLALVYCDQGRYDEAEQLYERALEGYEKLGTKHPDTLTIVNGLANLFRDQKQFTKAEQFYTRVLKGWEENLGPKHPYTLETVDGFARLRQQQNRRDEAEQLYKRALAGRMEKLGPNHPCTRNTMDSLASFYREQGRSYEAEQLFHL